MIGRWAVTVRLCSETLRECGHRGLAGLCQLETSCRVPGHGLHGRKCIAVAADSAAKIKNTEPGPLAITVTMTSPMPYPPDAASMARATPTMRNNAARIA